MQKPVRELPGRALSVKAGVSGLLSHCPLRAAHGFHLLHPFLDGGFGEVGALLKLLQHTGAFVLLLEALDRAVNGFVFRYNNTDQLRSPPSVVYQSPICRSIGVRPRPAARLAPPVPSCSRGAVAHRAFRMRRQSHGPRRRSVPSTQSYRRRPIRNEKWPRRPCMC